MKFAIFKKWFWAFVFLFACLTAGAVAKSAEPAELILHNGFVWTVDEANPQAEAIAIRGGKIVKVGKNAEALALRNKDTRVIDLKGAFVIPGFNDNHVHFSSAAQFFWNIQLMDVHKDNDFVARVREYIAMRPGEPIRGGWGAYEQWEIGASRSGEKAKKAWTADRRLIDSVTGNTPMFVSQRLTIEESIKAHTWGSA